MLEKELPSFIYIMIHREFFNSHLCFLCNNAERTAATSRSILCNECPGEIVESRFSNYSRHNPDNNMILNMRCSSVFVSSNWHTACMARKCVWKIDYVLRQLILLLFVADLTITISIESLFTKDIFSPRSTLKPK